MARFGPWDGLPAASTSWAARQSAKDRRIRRLLIATYVFAALLFLAFWLLAIRIWGGLL